MNAQIQAVFRKRKITYTVLILAVLGIYFFAFAMTKLHLSQGIQSFPKAFVWIGENLIPDELAMRRFPNILNKLMETVPLSVAVTVIAAVFAFFASLCGSHVTVALQVFFTQYAAKFAEKTLVYACEDRF